MSAREVLDGIDKTEDESDTGWWTTSKGQEFGARKLAEVEALLVEAQAQALRDAADQPLPAPKNGQTSGFREWLRARAATLEAS